eukprot:jgi/Chrzof1/13910/Cz08g17040.t1
MLAPIMPGQLVPTPKAASIAQAAGAREGSGETSGTSSMSAASRVDEHGMQRPSRVSMEESSVPTKPAAGPQEQQKTFTTAASMDLGTELVYRPSVINPALSKIANVAVIAAFSCYSFYSWQRALAVAARLIGMWLMWRSMNLLMSCAATPMHSWLGLTLAPHFINPLAATSLTDFWARRWNITQALVLRYWCYLPIVEQRLVNAEDSDCGGYYAPAPAAALKRYSSDGSNASNSEAIVKVTSAGYKSVSYPPRWKRQLATAVTFIISGIEHEVFHWYIMHKWDWTWLMFFTMQGPLLAVEGILKRRSKQYGLTLDPAVARLAVLLVLGIAADLWFWPVVTQPVLLSRLATAMTKGSRDIVALMQVAGWLPQDVGAFVRYFTSGQAASGHVLWDKLNESLAAMA